MQSQSLPTLERIKEELFSEFLDLHDAYAKENVLHAGYRVFRGLSDEEIEALKSLLVEHNATVKGDNPVELWTVISVRDGFIVRTNVEISHRFNTVVLYKELVLVHVKPVWA